MTRIGFVGLGHMGLPMAINLIKAGHRVTGFDLQQAALQALVNAGGKAATHIHETVAQQDCLITMLQSGQQVREVCLQQGLYDIAHPQTMHIDCSTIDVSSSQELHKQAVNMQLYALDAPVSGGVSGANAASLTFMVGGATSHVELATPILSAMGKKIIHTGHAGSGQAAKICNNLILGITMIAVAEAFSLAEKLGLSAQKLHEVVSNSSGQCWVTNQYLPIPNVLPHVPANYHYQPGFAVTMMLKDLQLSQDSANMVGIHTQLGELATKLYKKCHDAGAGNLDFSVIINHLN